MSLAARYDELPSWCTPQQAASFLGVSQRLVYRMLDEGRLPCAWRTSAGGRWKISKECLAALVGLPPQEGAGHAV